MASVSGIGVPNLWNDGWNLDAISPVPLMPSGTGSGRLPFVHQTEFGPLFLGVVQFDDLAKV